MQVRPQIVIGNFEEPEMPLTFAGKGRRKVQLGRGGAGSRVCAAEPMKQTRRTGRNTEQSERGDRPKQCDNVSDRKPMARAPTL